jgi:hypothetical protein
VLGHVDYALVISLLPRVPVAGVPASAISRPLPPPPPPELGLPLPEEPAPRYRGQ